MWIKKLVLLLLACASILAAEPSWNFQDTCAFRYHRSIDPTLGRVLQIQDSLNYLCLSVGKFKEVQSINYDQVHLRDSLVGLLEFSVTSCENELTLANTKDSLAVEKDAKCMKLVSLCEAQRTSYLEALSAKDRVIAANDSLKRIQEEQIRNCKEQVPGILEIIGYSIALFGLGFLGGAALY